MTSEVEYIGICRDKMQEVAWEYILALPSVNTRFVPLSELPARPAIYFVLDNSHDLIYVGKSLSLRDRWRNHQLKGLIGEVEIFYQLYDYDIDSEQLDGDPGVDEAVFIGLFRPRYNKVMGSLRL